MVSRWGSRFFVLCLTTMSVVSHSAIADPPREATADVQARYKAHFVKISAQYQNINGSGAQRDFGVKDGKLTGASTYKRFNFSRSAGALRIDRLKSESRRVDGQAVTGPTAFLGYNPRESFSGLADPAEGSFVISRVEKTTPQRINSTHRQFAWCFDSPYSIAHLNLAEIIGDPGWKMLEPAEIERDGQRLTLLTLCKGNAPIRFSDVTMEKRNLVCNVLLDPAANDQIVAYATVASTPVYKSRYLNSGVVLYVKDAAGHALPKQLRQDSFLEDPNGSNIKLVADEEVKAVLRERAIVDLQNLNFIPRPPADFELSAFQAQPIDDSKVKIDKSPPPANGSAVPR